MIRVQCEVCKKESDLPDDFAGRKVQCGSCGFKFRLAPLATNTTTFHPVFEKETPKKKTGCLPIVLLVIGLYFVLNGLSAAAMGFPPEAMAISVMLAIGFGIAAAAMWGKKG